MNITIVFTHDDVADLLDRAADDIEMHGHQKHEFGVQRTGPKCALGAVRWQVLPNVMSNELDDMREFIDCSRWTDRHIALYRAADVALKRHLNCQITTWNDQPSTEPGQVIDELRFAAKRVRDGDLDWTVRS